MANEPETLRQVSRRLGIPAYWLKAEADAGRIPCLRAGSRLLFAPDAVNHALVVMVRPVSHRFHRRWSFTPHQMLPSVAEMVLGIGFLAYNRAPSAMFSRYGRCGQTRTRALLISRQSNGPRLLKPVNGLESQHPGRQYNDRAASGRACARRLTRPALVRPEKG